MDNIHNYYNRKINIAIDIIENSYHKKVEVGQLAEVSGISLYHFHRIFKAVTGETVINYIKTFKMGKIYKSLMVSDKKIIDIAMDLGYQNSANLARDIRKYFDCSASDIRSGKVNPIKKGVYKEKQLNIKYLGPEDIEDRNIVYERVSSGYNTDIISGAFKKLYNVLISSGCDIMKVTSLGIGHDDPDYIDSDKCRYDACIIVDNLKNMDLSMFNSTILKGGRYASFLFEGSAGEFINAWDYIFKKWVINSSYIPDNRPHIEEYLPSDSYNSGIYKAKLLIPIVK